MRTIKAEDRFEWENLVNYSDIPKHAAKCIFIRDIHKTWHITGINHKINSIDKLIEFLKEITQGYQIITVGSSAGGYMSALVGAKLNAHLAFSFSGQFSLYANPSPIPNYYWLNKYKKREEKINIIAFVNI